VEWALKTPPTTAKVVSSTCPELLHDMAERLQDVKTDVAKLDRIGLWHCVTSGIESLRTLVDAGGGGSISTSPSTSTSLQVTKANVVDIVMREVVPLLELSAVDVSSSFGGAAGLAGDSSTSADSAASCWRLCGVKGASSCAVATYNAKTQTCAMARSYAPLSALAYGAAPDPGMSLLVSSPDPEANYDATFVCGQPKTNATSTLKTLLPPPGSGDDHAAYCAATAACGAYSPDELWKPSAGFDAVLTTSALAGPHATVCVKASPAKLYATLVDGGIAKTMQDQAQAIASQLVAVVQKYRYRLNLVANRGVVDKALSAFYGADIYSAKVSPVVDDILVRVSAGLAAAKAGGGTVYADSSRFAAKLAAMPSGEVAGVGAGMAATLRCTKDHRDMFPVYRSQAPCDTLWVFVGYGSVAAFTAFIVFMVMSSAASYAGSINMAGLVQRVILSVAVFMILVVVAETMATKVTARSTHNFDAIDTNGNGLIAALATASRSMEAMPTSGAPPGLYGEIEAAIQAYDRCNFVTSGQPGMPFPLSDVVMYSAIALAVLVVTFLLVGMIDPIGNVESIRRLFKVKARLLRGDYSPATGMGAVLRTIECCSPPGFVWSMFVWFAIVAFFFLAWWFMFNNDTAAYVDAIQTDPDCVR
jgi:hypothetical protein